MSIPTGSQAGVFRFGPFAFDCRLRQLFRNDDPRHLLPKAQRLLHLLLLERPRALSRDEIIEVLWPSTYVSDTSLATVVNELRRALDDDARTPQYIRTVHGFGYAFCGEVTTAAATGVHAATLVWEGHHYPLYEGENTIGRADDNSIVLSDDTISRHHALMTIEGGVMRLQDLGSKNGTFVDGQRIDTTPVIVKSQSRIELGAVMVSIMPGNASSTKSLRLNMPELKRDVATRLAALPK